MSLDIIDLVSSSPPPPPPHRLKRAAETGCHAQATARTQHTTHPDLLFLSDQDIDDFDLSLGRVRGKRRKTSPPLPLVTQAPTLSSRPPLVLGRNAALNQRAPDPIEVSSSMEQTSPKHRPHAALEEMAQPDAAQSRVAAAVYMNSDPFASSPDPPRLGKSSKTGPLAKRAVSLDPFVGSSSQSHTIGLSPRHPAASKKASSVVDSSPPAQRVAELDHDQYLASTSRLERRGKHHDVISIESSSSDGTDDSDLPDVLEIDISRRPLKPRSPLRRSRSDTVSTAARSNRHRETRTADLKKTRAAESAADKEHKRRERDQAKQAKAKEKERAAALAEANKLRTDKKVSTPEMIVNFPSTLGAEYRDQVQILLTELGVEHAIWESPVQGIVKWLRKVTCHFNLDLGRWEPIPPRVREEKHALAILTAEDFVESMLNDELETHARTIKDHFAGYRIIYILQGMTQWMRKNRNTRNRQFTSVVRTDHATVPVQDRRRRREAAEYIPEDQVEDAMLRLQVAHGVLIHHTTTSIESAKWVVTFTQHISTIPYRKQKDHATSTAGFCMESGQVRTGDGPKDTYVRLLQEIVRITAPIAYGVVNEFDGLSKLVHGLESGGPERLESIKKSANKDGQLSDRSIGQAVSRRLHKVFTGRDELSTDI